MARLLAEGAKENRRLSARLRDLEFGDEDSVSDPESDDDSDKEQEKEK